MLDCHATIWYGHHNFNDQHQQRAYLTCLINTSTNKITHTKYTHTYLDFNGFHVEVSFQVEFYNQAFVLLMT